MMLQVDTSDLHKIKDILSLNVTFNKARDEMNAATHCAPAVRYSALTVNTMSALDRVDELLSLAGSSQLTIGFPT